MRAVETNVLVRLIAQDDDGQTESAERFVQEGAWISILALAEAMWVLASVYGRDAQQVATAVDMLLNHKSLAVQDADAVAAALERFRAQPALGFSDCLMLELARKAGNLPLGTFDRRLGTVDGAQRLR